MNRPLLISLLLAADLLGKDKKPKPPKPSACVANICVSDFYSVSNDSALVGTLTNGTNATISDGGYMNFVTKGDDGQITGAAIASLSASIPPGGRYVFHAFINSGPFPYYIIDSLKFHLCVELDGKRTCGEESVNLVYPIFGGLGAFWSERRWKKQHGY